MTVEEFTLGSVPTNLRAEIESVINRCCAENGSNTPDWVLSRYLVKCLAAFDEATKARDSYYGITTTGTSATVSGEPE